ncbi:hypothetical protein NC651_006100 [Populus alba x Populus x berolinensis]|nr:hypothetical protein NC651_006100 [Populus alba x Populus x berolinensis]
MRINEGMDQKKIGREPLCQWWWVLIAGTLRTFYSQLSRSDHLCWGLCFFVFFFAPLTSFLPKKVLHAAIPALAPIVFHLHCTLCLL